MRARAGGARRAAVALLLPLALLLLPAPAGAQEWKERIDRLWADAERGEVTDGCQAQVVRAFPPLLRGSTSDRGCVVKAVAAARDGDEKLANAWLQAGWCDNPIARKQIERAGDEAVRYAVSRYGSEVP